MERSMRNLILILRVVRLQNHMFGSNFEDNIHSQRLIEFLSASPQREFELIRYLQTMKASKEEFSLIKNLIKHYGTQVVICFSAFYDNLKIEDVRMHEADLMEINALIRIFTEGKDILEFRKMLSITRKGQAFGDYQLTKEMKIFNSFIFDLSQKASRVSLFCSKQTAAEQQQEFNNLIDKKLELATPHSTFATYFIEQIIESTIESFRAISSKSKQKESMSRPISQPGNLQRKSLVAEKEKKAEKRAESETTPLCCRTYFEEEEMIRITESQRIEFKNYFLDYRNHFGRFECENLLKTMCSFLNGLGGIIYVGFKEFQSSLYKVVPVYQNQKKEAFVREIDVLAKEILPHIEEAKCRVEQVKVRTQKGNGCVFKIIIYQGDPDKMYFYRDGPDDWFCFRNNSSVDRFPLNQYVLGRYMGRLDKPPGNAPPMHEGKCLSAYDNPSSGLQVSIEGQKKYGESYRPQRRDKSRSISPFRKYSNSKKVVTPDKFKELEKNKPQKFISRDQFSFLVYSFKDTAQLQSLLQNQPMLTESSEYEQVWSGYYILKLYEGDSSAKQKLIRAMKKPFAMQSISEKLIPSSKADFGQFEKRLKVWQKQPKNGLFSVEQARNEKYFKFKDSTTCAKAYCTLTVQYGLEAKFLMDF